MKPGASTNTPSLGAGAQSLSSIAGIEPDRLALPALAYAVTYPAAIVGIIGTLLLLQQVFRIDPVKEAAEFARKNQRHIPALERRTLVVTNPNLEGVRRGEIPGRLEAGGTREQVELASYICDYLVEEFESLWKKYSKEHGLKGLREKNSSALEKRLNSCL